MQFFAKRAVRTGGALAASLLCGAAAVAGAGPAAAAGSTYVIASSNELTGPVASLGEPYVSGFQTYIDTINSKGGVDGHKIRLTVLDDAASPTTGVSNTQQLLQSNPVAFLAPIASAVGDPQQNLLNRAKVPAVAYTGVEGQLTSPYYYAVGLDGTDTMNISAQFIKSLAKGKKVRIGFLTIISPATSAAVAETKKLTDSYGWKYTGQVQYNLSSPDYSASAAQVKQENPNYIIMASPDGQAQEMMAALKSQGVNVPVVNFEAGNATSTFVAADNPNFYAVREFYDPSTGNKAVAPMNAAARRYGETKNMQGLAFTKGWVAGQVLVNALKQCSGGGKTCSPADVTKHLNATSNFATGLGQNVKISKTNHAGIRCGTIYQLKPPATAPVPASKNICSTSPLIKAASS